MVHFKVQFIDTTNWKQLKWIWNLYEPKLKISNGLIDSNIYHKQTLFTLTALQTFHGLIKENIMTKIRFFENFCSWNVYVLNATRLLFTHFTPRMTQIEFNKLLVCCYCLRVSRFFFLTNSYLAWSNEMCFFLRKYKELLSYCVK